MASFNLVGFGTTAQLLQNGEYGFVAASGVLSVSVSTAISVVGSDTILNIAGAVFAANGGAIQASSINTVISITGEIGGRLYGINITDGGVAGNVEIFNSGTIRGLDDGADAILAFSGGNRIVNRGEILSVEDDAIQFNRALSGIAAANLVENFGLISASGPVAAAILGGLDEERLVNHGTIIGRVETGGGDDRVTNSGVIEGGVTLGEGADVYDGRGGGRVAGVVAGGPGDDAYFLDDPLTEIAEAEGEGFDTVHVAFSTGLDAFAHVEALVLLGASALDAEGSARNDRLTGNDAANRLIGNAGDDAIAAKGGRDTVEGGGGHDSLDGGAGDDTLDGGEGDDTVEGGGGDDLVRGGAGRDIVRGDGSGTPGNDTLSGGPGRDTLDGGAGTDTVDYGADDGPLGVVVNMSDTLRYGVLPGQARDGWREADTLIGVERILGTALPDKLVGGAGSDTLHGGAGGDALLGDSGDDMLDGGGGNDRLIGWRGADLLIGGEGDDTLLGDFDDDVLAGGRGHDRLQGGAGRDTFVFENGWGEDRVLDYNTFTEKLDFTGHSLVDTIADLAITETAGSAVITDAEGNRLVLVGVAASTISTGDFLF